jgi:hypothetical protein
VDLASPRCTGSRTPASKIFVGRPEHRRHVGAISTETGIPVHCWTVRRLDFGEHAG